jgi:hypothetical protein
LTPAAGIRVALADAREVADEPMRASAWIDPDGELIRELTLDLSRVYQPLARA